MRPTLISRLRDAWRSMLGEVEGEPTPGTGAVPVTPVDHSALTTATLSQVREWIDSHDDGDFTDSALFSALARRDADLFGALQQRVLPMGSHPVSLVPADDSARAKTVAQDMAARLHATVTGAAINDMVSDAVLLGFAVAQVVWRFDEDTRALMPRVMPWPAASVEYHSTSREWKAQTRTGLVTITPGDGQWILYAPRSECAPHLWGAIRCTGEWYLRASHAAADASRHAEVHGIPVWKAFLPSGARETADGKAFARSLRTMGRNGVVPCPRGDSDASSYDVELMSAETDAYRIFEFLLTGAGGRMRLAILGQDLTSQNNKVGTNASSETGAAITDEVIEADARTLSECLTEQLYAPWARYLGAPSPRLVIDAEPEGERLIESQTMTAAAAAAKAWADLGVAVDFDAMARRARVPLIARD